MIQNLKFRVWDTKLCIIFPWNLFIRFDDPAYVIMQNTGFQDEDGKNIFVGDIIECKNGLYSVIFARGAFCVRKIEKQIGDYGSLYHQWAVSLEDGKSTCKIIGNIWENPELLK